MAHRYSAENHDWDLTLHAAYVLAVMGREANHLPTTGTLRERAFSCFLGSMLLSFSAIESFSASVAFSMPNTERFKEFDFERYRRTSQFWSKIEMLFAAIPYEVDKSGGLFQTIRMMQDWRNLVTHAKPYRIEETEIENTLDAPARLNEPFHALQYTRQVDFEHAQKFYSAAVDYTKLLTNLTSISPLATAKYSGTKRDK